MRESRLLVALLLVSVTAAARAQPGRGTLPGQGPAPTPAAEAPAARPASASVTLSPLSSGIAAAASGLKDVDGDFDASRVAEVRQALDQGRYTIDAGRIADAVISQMALSASPRLQ